VDRANTVPQGSDEDRVIEGVGGDGATSEQVAAAYCIGVRDTGTFSTGYRVHDTTINSHIATRNVQMRLISRQKNTRIGCGCASNDFLFIVAPDFSDCQYERTQVDGLRPQWAMPTTTDIPDYRRHLSSN
jgi:hypothetical protein